MIDRVYVTVRIQRQLEQMERQTSTPAVAAERARTIIDSLVSGNARLAGSGMGTCQEGGSARFGAGLMRYRRDRRVKNSLKFNLGQGYRLVCIKEKNSIYVMFAGDHDSSDAWLDHFTKKRPHKAESAMTVLPVTHAPVSRPGMAAAPNQAFPYDPLQKDISQEMLRRIFRGLCAQRG